MRNRGKLSGNSANLILRNNLITRHTTRQEIEFINSLHNNNAVNDMTESAVGRTLFQY